MGKFYIKPSDESENGVVKLEYDKNNIIHLDDIPDIDFDMKMTSVNEKYYKYVTKMCRHTPEYRDFIQFMKQAIIVYRDATGTFYYDRYKPLFEGVTNLILSIILVKFLGLSGVLIGTIITNLTICAIIEPYVLYKHGFQTSPKKLYIYYYKNNSIL